MTQEEVRAIIAERLPVWGSVLATAHATPLLLIGVGHDRARGDLVIVTLEDLTGDYVAGFLLAAAQKARAAGPKDGDVLTTADPARYKEMPAGTFAPCPHAACELDAARLLGAGRRWVVRCSACGVQGPYARSEADAITAWNAFLRRAGSG